MRHNVEQPLERGAAFEGHLGEKAQFVNVALDRFGRDPFQSRQSVAFVETGQRLMQFLPRLRNFIFQRIENGGFLQKNKQFGGGIRFKRFRFRQISVQKTFRIRFQFFFESASNFAGAFL